MRQAWLRGPLSTCPCYRQKWQHKRSRSAGSGPRGCAAQLQPVQPVHAERLRQAQPLVQFRRSDRNQLTTTHISPSMASVFAATLVAIVPDSVATNAQLWSGTGVVVPL